MKFTAAVALILILTCLPSVGRAQLSNAHQPVQSPTSVESAVKPSLVTGSVVVTTSANPVVFGRPLTLTATVTPSSATGGRVTFYDGSNVAGFAILANGKATLTTTLLPAGLRSLKAYYWGDGAVGPATSAAVSQTVTPLPVSSYPISTAYAAGLEPVSAVAGDFNADGRADFVVANYFSGTVSVFLSNPDGTFQGPFNSAAGINPYALVVGDFNSDGRPDLAVTNFNTDGKINILLGNGDGFFQAPVLATADSGPRAIAAADFNGDGTLDLVVANSYAGNVTVYSGRGDGTFVRSANYAILSGSSPSGVTVADVTGDGKVDLIVTDDSDGSVWVLPGNGDGTFQVTALPHSSGGVGPRSVVASDFNGDGLTDLAVANFADGTVAVLLGSGGGNFLPALLYHLSSNPNSLSVSDFNGDGILDLAAADGSNVTLLIGNGNGTFQAPVDYAAGGIVNSLALGDFNSDGVVDIVTATNNTANVLLGKPAILTTTTLTSSANPSTYGQSVTLTATVSSGAVTGNITFYDDATILGVRAPAGGQATLVVSTLTFGAHSIRAAYSGDGTFAANISGVLQQTVGGTLPGAVLTSSANPSVFGQSVLLTATMTPATAFGNVTFYDGTTVLGVRPIVNGVATLLTSQLAAGVRALKVFYSYAAIGTPPTTTATLSQTINTVPSSSYPAAISLGAGSQPRAVVAADFTGDGRVSLAVANSGSGNVSVLTGNGDGTFRTAVNYVVGSNSVALASGDFNLDGKNDLAVVNSGNNNVNILRGNGDGTFAVVLALLTGNAPSAVAVGDFNGDGKPDLAITNQGDGNVIVYLGNGDGTFQAAARFATGGTSPSSIAVGDFNGDGKADLVVTNVVAGCTNCAPIPYVSVLTGNGDGTFQAPQVNYGPGCSTANCAVAPAYKPSAVVVGDFNGDGKADIAVADQIFNGVNVFLGNGNGTFQGSVGIGTAAGGPASLAIGDFNGDGKADLAVPNQTGNNVSLLFGNGNGTFTLGTSYSTGTQPVAVAVSDVNQDGKPDIVVANFGSNNLSLFLGASASQLKFNTQPVNTVGGVALPAIVVQVLDSSGNVDTSSTATVTLTSIPPAITVAVNAVKGVATFNGLMFNAGGTYTLLASAVGYPSASSNSFVVSATPTVAIDSPAPGAIITSGSTTIIGWALESASGVGTAITLVQVKVDGVVVGNATYGLSRPDVCTAYPGRPGCPNVGYSFLVNTSGLSTGAHTITVSATDSAAVPSTGSNTVTVQVTQLALTGSRAGIYRAGVGFLEDTNGNGIGPNPTDPADRTAAFAPPGGVLAGDLPVIGDWTGDGHAKAGFYRPSTGTWWLDANNSGTFDAGDFTYNFGGLAGDLPVVGDWNAVAGVSANKTCIGIYRTQGSVWLLDLNCNGTFDGTPADAFFPFGGIAGDVPVVGNWTGGTTRVGVVRKYAPGGVPVGNPFFWVLDAGNANAGNSPDNHPPAPGSFAYGGLAGDSFVTGDWNNSGVSRAGVYRSGLWILDVNGAHTPDLMFPYGGLATDIPLPGKW